MSGRHDAAYKTLFAHPTFVQQLMQGFAPAEISKNLDYSTLTKHPDSYITPALKQKLQDVVWSVRWNAPQSAKPNASHNTPPASTQNNADHALPTEIYLCLLLEFQLRADYHMPLRMLQYTAAFYSTYLKKHKLNLKTDQLPLVFPIVLYHGKPKWHPKMAIQSLLAPFPQELKPYQPHQHYFLIDERRLSNALLFEQSTPLSGLFAIGNASSATEFKQAAQMLVSAAKRHPDWSHIQNTIEKVANYYLQRDTTKDNVKPITFEELPTMNWIARDIEKAKQEARTEALSWIERDIEKAKQEARTEALSWIERDIEKAKQEARTEALSWIERDIEKAKQEARVKGIEQGTEQSRITFAKRLIQTRSFDEAQIAELTDLSLAQVKQLKAQSTN